jgi:heptosyltransferase-1
MLLSPKRHTEAVRIQLLNILIVKLSSLGDVVHTMPAVQDIRRAFPQANIDWVVEKGFAPLVQRCAGVRRIIPCELRRWRKAPFAASTHAAWKTFRAELQHEAYDAVIDLQGLSKSALVAWLARLAPGGRRYALANRTDGSGYEAPTRWVADVTVRVTPHVHAVQRSRLLCAKALGYAVLADEVYGLHPQAASERVAVGMISARPCVALVHGTSRADKQWPAEHWIELARRLDAEGCDVALLHGTDDEQRRSESLAQRMPNAVVWPRLALDALTDALATTAGVIGVDSGLSHIAVALDLPHVQLYNFDTAWRTGPVDRPRQRCVYAQPVPTVEGVWSCWRTVSGETA